MTHFKICGVVCRSAEDVKKVFADRVKARLLAMDADEFAEVVNESMSYDAIYTSLEDLLDNEVSSYIEAFEIGRDNSVDEYATFYQYRCGKIDTFDADDRECITDFDGLADDILSGDIDNDEFENIVDDYNETIEDFEEYESGAAICDALQALNIATLNAHKIADAETINKITAGINEILTAAGIIPANNEEVRA